MDAREQRGIQLASTAKLTQKGNLWIVPSQSGEDPYRVELAKDTPSCTCPDHSVRAVKCKHIWAAEYTIRRETAPDGTTTVVTTARVTKEKRMTYRQDWPAYNLAQTHEKEHVVELLHGLCEGIVQPKQLKGRPRLPLAELVFAAALKVYGTLSARRTMCDLRDCQAKGWLTRLPCYNSIFNVFEDEALTPLLKTLIEESAAPLKAIEANFTVDSSGFSSSRFDRWFDEKYGKLRSEHQWIKAHLMSGVKTNIVTSAEVTGPDSNDSPHLPPLLAATTNRFTVEELSGDKGYISAKNLEAVVNAGGIPYIPFKINTTGEGPELWRKLYHYFLYRREEFLQHYHQRSNAETVFSMIKAKFGDSLRSRMRTAQINEALCKVLCHNLCCLVSAIYELGIEPTFWAEAAVAQEVAG
ncbi:MAG TPA: transposase [Candidatus Binatia bacterium]|nr:transposase [Candidatus Binatia bacterium]